MMFTHSVLCVVKICMCVLVCASAVYYRQWFLHHFTIMLLLALCVISEVHL